MVVDPIVDIKDAALLVAHHFAAMWTVIRGAPDGLTIILALMAVLMWLSFRKYYAHAFSSKQGIIDNKDAAIEALRERQQLKDDQIKELARQVGKSPQEDPSQILRATIAKLESLEQRVKSLRQRSLSVRQRDALVNACKDAIQTGPAMHFGVCFNSWNREAENYARDFAEVFNQVGMSLGMRPTGDYDVPRELEGLIIAVQDPTNAPANAHRLAAILTKAEVSCELGAKISSSSLPSNYFVLVVGRAKRDEGLDNSL